MAHLPTDGGIKTTLFHEIAEVGIRSRLDLVEAFHARVVWIAPGEHHVTGRVAVADLDVGVLKAEAFAGQLIDMRGRSLEFAAKSADRVTGHVIHGDQEDIGLRSHGYGESEEKAEQG